ncbi:hypothetical protein FKR60_24115, partial [Salmonella enterica subsp. enterica]|nr:hypothetical protein [Salmonella enterica subsp. enterica]
RIKSNASTSSLSASGVPFTFTSMLIGTLSGGVASRKTWPSLTDEGRTLTLEGPTHPARR